MAENPHIQYNYADGELEGSHITGIGRLSPYLFVGGNDKSYMTIDQYDKVPSLRHFRASVSELPVRGKDARYSGKPIFDLDTKSLYFGHSSQSGSVQNSKIVIGEQNRGGPEGLPCLGLPVRLQEVHFRAFNPSGNSDEYSAFFLVSDPVGAINASNTGVSGFGRSGFLDFSGKSSESLFLSSDYRLHHPDNTGNTKQFKSQNWSHYQEPTERLESGISSFGERLVIGDPLTVSRHSGFFRSGCYDALPTGIQSGIEDGTISGADRYSYSGYKENQTYDIDSPKNNTYLLSFDTDTMILKQSFLPESVTGHKYQYPMDAIISAKSVLDTGFLRPQPDCSGVFCDITGSGNCINGNNTTGSGSFVQEFDSVKVDLYDSSGILRPSGYLLTRPEPKNKFDVLTSHDGYGWDSQELPLFFPFKVTHRRVDSVNINEAGSLPLTINEGYISIPNPYGNIESNGYNFTSFQVPTATGFEATGEYITIKHTYNPDSEEERVIQFSSIDSTGLDSNLLTPSNANSRGPAKHFPIAHIEDWSDETGFYCYKIEQLQFGDVDFRPAKVEWGNFDFKCTVNSDGYVNIEGGWLKIANSNSTWDGYFGEGYRVGVRAYSFYLRVQRDGGGVIGLEDKNHEPSDADQEFEEGTILYPIATVDLEGNIKQSQIGSILDRNIPDVPDWPRGDKFLGTFEKYDVFQVGSEAGYTEIESLRAQ